MLDMGGMATPSSSKTRMDTGKNNKIRAVVLDFDLVTKSIDMQRTEIGSTTPKNSQYSSPLDSALSQQTFPNSNANTNASTSGGKSGMTPTRTEEAVQQFAKLLGVSLHDNHDGTGKTNRSHEKDDLSLLLLDGSQSSKNHGGDKKHDHASPPPPVPIPVSSAKSSSPQPSHAGPSLDVRTKYAQKLRQKVEGGLAGLELAKHKREEMTARGDAAGHLAARALVAATTGGSAAGSKWMANTGTGSLLSFLSMRSMKIALVPSPRIYSADEKSVIQREMEDLTRQLPNVHFHLLVEGISEQKEEEDERGSSGSARDGKSRIAKILLERVTQGVEMDPISTMVVSDQDDLLRVARDLGYFTCRVRRKNAPRGNVTTNFTVECIQDVKDAVNELVGISYNAVFSSSSVS